MQETTAGPAQYGTGSATIADIVSLAAQYDLDHHFVQVSNPV